jgi:D-arabinose 1-dehydrogenase-like Zn-dependent alcohol dehydrogenase
LIDLVHKHEIKPPPIAERPLRDASPALDDLRAGKIVGRVVLRA